MDYKLGIGTAVAMCLSAIIGDTLFVVTGIPIAQAGSYALMAYIIVGILALVIALQLGELGSIMPGKKGVAYSYVGRSFGSELGFITGVLLFISYCAIVSAITFSFGGYLMTFLGINSQPLQIITAIALIIFISFLNMRGVKETSSISKVLIVITLLAAIAFVVYSITYSSHKSILGNFTSTAAQSSPSAFTQAITTVVFAYAGFQTITSFTDKIKGQGTGLAKVLIYSMIISIISYVGVAFAFILLVPASQSIPSPEPILYALNFVGAPEYIIAAIVIGTLIAIAASIISIIYTASRLIFQLGFDGLLPAITRKYNNRTDVPTNGIWIAAIVSIIILFTGDLYQILSISNFGIIFSWIMCCLSVISLRRRKVYGSFKAPLYPYLPIIGIISSIVFMLGLPMASLILGVVMIFMLIAAYYSLAELTQRDLPKVRLFD